MLNLDKFLACYSILSLTLHSHFTIILYVSSQDLLRVTIEEVITTQPVVVMTSLILILIKSSFGLMFGTMFQFLAVFGSFGPTSFICSKSVSHTIQVMFACHSLSCKA